MMSVARGAWRLVCDAIDTEWFGSDMQKPILRNPIVRNPIVSTSEQPPSQVVPMDFDVPYQAKLHPGCQSTGFLGHPDQDYSKQHYPPNWILQI
jgi:hypothetical protein